MVEDWKLFLMVNVLKCIMLMLVSPKVQFLTFLESRTSWHTSVWSPNNCWIVEWGQSWLVTFNAEKTELLASRNFHGQQPATLKHLFLSSWTSFFQWIGRINVISIAKSAASHLWQSECLSLLDRVQCRIVNMGPVLSASLDPLSHRRDSASLSLLYKYFMDTIHMNYMYLL